MLSDFYKLHHFNYNIKGFLEQTKTKKPIIKIESHHIVEVRDSPWIKMKSIVLCFPLIFLAVAKELVNNFQKWRTHCFFTTEVQFRSRSQLQCAAMCGENGYFDVFRYRKGKCFCADSNGGFSQQTTLDVRNVYVRRNPQPVSEFILKCLFDILLRNPLKSFLLLLFWLVILLGMGWSFCCFVVIFLNFLNINQFY